jgi:hypothetical protein
MKDITTMGGIEGRAQAGMRDGPMPALLISRDVSASQIPPLAGNVDRAGDDRLVLLFILLQLPLFLLRQLRFLSFLSSPLVAFSGIAHLAFSSLQKDEIPASIQPDGAARKYSSISNAADEVPENARRK